MEGSARWTTLSHSDGGRASGLLELLRERLPALSVPLLVPRDDLIEKEVELLTLKYGAAAMEKGPPPDTLAEIEAALTEGAGGVARLHSSRLKHVPHVLLHNKRVARGDGAVVDAYLARLGEAGSSAPRRLWTHYLLTLEDGDPATLRIASWLEGVINSLPERLQDFTRKYEVFEPRLAHVRMAIELLKGDGLAQDFDRIGLGLSRVLTSALMASILGSVGRLLSEGANPPRPVERMKDAFGDGIRNAVHQTQAHEKVKHRAVSALMEGFVAWRRRIDPQDAAPDPVLDLLVTLNMDPRFSPGRWDGVDKPTVSIVEKWLTRQTIEAFFRVVNRLQTDRPDMWEERRAFWLRYVPFVSKAWLVLGESAASLAREEKVRFGAFSGGANRDHCGLLLEIDDLRVLEMNMNGRAILWRPAQIQRRVFPDFNEVAPFDRGSLTAFVKPKELWRGGAIGLAHMSGWQRKFADQIQQNTRRGIRPPGL